MPAAVQLRPKVTTPPRRSPERAALAEAIARHDAATQRLARIKAALELTPTLDARDAVRKATAALEEAKAGEGAHLAAVALHEVATADSPVADATRAVEQAEAALEQARRTRDALLGEEAAAERELGWAKSRLDDAVRDVMKSVTQATVATLLKEAEAVQADLVNRRVVLRHLHRAGCVAEPVEQDVRRFLMDISVLPATYGQVEYQAWDNHPAQAAWRSAFDALVTNADAPLPSS